MLANGRSSVCLHELTFGALRHDGSRTLLFASKAAHWRQIASGRRFYDIKMSRNKPHMLANGRSYSVVES